MKGPDLGVREGGGRKELGCSQGCEGFGITYLLASKKASQRYNSSRKFCLLIDQYFRILDR